MSRSASDSHAPRRNDETERCSCAVMDSLPAPPAVPPAPRRVLAGEFVDATRESHSNKLWKRPRAVCTCAGRIDDVSRRETRAAERAHRASRNPSSAATQTRCAPSARERTSSARIPTAAYAARRARVSAWSSEARNTSVRTCARGEAPSHGSRGGSGAWQTAVRTARSSWRDKSSSTDAHAPARVAQ